MSVTKTMAAVESASPAGLLARSPRMVMDVHAGVAKAAEVVPLTGAEVFPGFPTYQWKEMEVPDADMVRWWFGRC